MKNNISTSTVLVMGIMLLPFFTLAQKTMNLEEAIKETIANNFDIQIAKNQTNIAKNNKSFLNRGFLPTLSASGNTQENLVDVESKTQTGETIALNNLSTSGNSANLTLNYVLLNGGARFITYKMLQQRYNISSIQAKQIIENTVLTLCSAYFELAKLQELKGIQEESVQISNSRLQRAKVAFEFGQNSKRDVLNATVDFQNDKINLQQTKYQIETVQRDLNLVMGSTVSVPVVVTPIEISPFELKSEQLISDSYQKNTNYLQVLENIKLAKNQIRLEKANWMPKINLTTSYSWAKNFRGATGFFASQFTQGFNFGLQVNWTVFDGGSRLNLINNAKINYNNAILQEKKLKESQKNALLNAYTNYLNAYDTYQLLKENKTLVRLNFERTASAYKLGQVTSIVFREAQRNLESAQQKLSTSKYDAELSKLRLWQLSGILLDKLKF